MNKIRDKVGKKATKWAIHCNLLEFDEKQIAYGAEIKMKENACKR